MVATVAALVLLAVATVACLGLLVPTLAGLFPRRRRGRPHPSTTFAVLVPAHDEEAGLPATLRSLAAQDYPPELVRVVVVADNCTDDTAGVARRAGAECLVRDDATRRGKGYAVAFGLDHVLGGSPDVVVVLDADCELHRSALRELAAVFAAGADVVQCVVRSRNADAGPSGLVAAVGSAVDEAVAAGWDRLGRSVRLRGTGMAFRSPVLRAVPWTAFGLAEDAEYAATLRAAGVRVRHCDGAVVLCDAPERLADLCRQRRRWRAAGVLGSKPLGLAVIALGAAAGTARGFTPWAILLVLLTAAVYLRAVWAVGLSWRRLRSLLHSPAVVGRLAWLALAGLFRHQPTAWDRTRRAGPTREGQAGPTCEGQAGRTPTATPTPTARQRDRELDLSGREPAR
jgi:1,2-diacylglycerol 3-beta-glucosyltransferase